jgi:hypothetical protein
LVVQSGILLHLDGCVGALHKALRIDEDLGIPWHAAERQPCRSELDGIDGIPVVHQ